MKSYKYIFKIFLITTQPLNYCIMPKSILQKELIEKRRERVKADYQDLIAKGKDHVVAILVLASRERVTENTIRNDLKA